MAQTLNIDDLPAPLGSAMRPWISIIETAPMGMGAEVMAAAANASLSLRQRIIPTPTLDNAIAEARLASDNLGISLDKLRGRRRHGASRSPSRPRNPDCGTA